MGPIIIFDKSLLESLNPDEAMWLDNFFLSNITPLFFVETLADLEKEVRTGRTPEHIVGSLAYKTPDYHSRPNVHHKTLLQGELEGAATIDMEYGRPHIGGGKTVELEGKTGVIFQTSPEEEALQRWQKHHFVEVERMMAQMWRRGLSNVDFEGNYKFFQTFFPTGKPRTLAAVKKFADLYIDVPDQERVLVFGLTLVGVDPEAQVGIVSRWRREGKPLLRTFAPYFMHIFSVDLFFNLAIAADLIGRGRASHKIDLAYLYYLPFCMVFTSSDKLHADIVPFFLRDNQTFVAGTDLKADLARLDAHYAALPDEVKATGVSSFATYPPNEGTFLVAQLWDKHMNSKWRTLPHQKPQKDSPVGKMIQEEMRRFEEAEESPNAPILKGDDADHMIIQRSVRGHKGKWTRFPPEVMNRRKNEKGEWEDIPPLEKE